MRQRLQVQHVVRPELRLLGRRELQLQLLVRGQLQLQRLRRRLQWRLRRRLQRRLQKGRTSTTSMGTVGDEGTELKWLAEDELIEAFKLNSGDNDETTSAISML